MELLARLKLRRLAEFLATPSSPSGTAQAALNCAAATLGAELGHPGQPCTPRPIAPPTRTLRLLPPDANCPRLRPYDDTDDTIRLRNCTFDRIAAHHCQLVGGANLAML